LHIQQVVALIAVVAKVVQHGYKVVVYVIYVQKVDYLAPHVALHSGVTMVAVQYSIQANVATMEQFTWTAIMK
jgi:hypothetical protein